MKKAKAPSKKAPKFPPIKINTYTDLLKQEPGILERIAATQNGGNLFMAHPFELLADVGVTLSKNVVNQILQTNPELSGLSTTPYQAIKAAGTQSVRFNIRGLFRRKTS